MGKVNMVAVDQRRLKLFLSLYRYRRKINTGYQRNVCLAIIQVIRTRQRRLTYIFYKLMKKVINLVKLLEKNDRKKCHADVSHEIGVGGLFTFATTYHFSALVSS